MKHNFKYMVFFMCSIVLSAMGSRRAPPTPPQWPAGVPRPSATVVTPRVITPLPPQPIAPTPPPPMPPKAPMLPPMPPQPPVVPLQRPPMPPPPPQFVQQIQQMQMLYNNLKSALGAKNAAQAQTALAVLENLVNSLPTPVRQFAETVLPADQYTPTLGKPTQADFFEKAKKYIATFTQPKTPVITPIARPVPPIPPATPVIRIIGGVPVQQPTLGVRVIAEPTTPLPEPTVPSLRAEDELPTFVAVAPITLQTYTKAMESESSLIQYLISDLRDNNKASTIENIWRRLYQQLTILDALTSAHDISITSEDVHNLNQSLNNTLNQLKNLLKFYPTVQIPEETIKKIDEITANLDDKAKNDNLKNRLQGLLTTRPSASSSSASSISPSLDTLAKMPITVPGKSSVPLAPTPPSIHPPAEEEEKKQYAAQQATQITPLKQNASFMETQDWLNIFAAQVNSLVDSQLPADQIDAQVIQTFQSNLPSLKQLIKDVSQKPQVQQDTLITNIAEFFHSLVQDEDIDEQLRQQIENIKQQIITDKNLQANWKKIQQKIEELFIANSRSTSASPASSLTLTVPRIAVRLLPPVKVGSRAYEDYLKLIQGIDGQVLQLETTLPSKSDRERAELLQHMWDQFYEQLSLLQEAAHNPHLTINQADDLWIKVNQTLATLATALIAYYPTVTIPEATAQQLAGLRDYITQRETREFQGLQSEHAEREPQNFEEYTTRINELAEEISTKLLDATWGDELPTIRQSLQEVIRLLNTAQHTLSPADMQKLRSLSSITVLPEIINSKKYSSPEYEKEFKELAGQLGVTPARAVPSSATSRPQKPPTAASAPLQPSIPTPKPTSTQRPRESVAELLKNVGRAASRLEEMLQNPENVMQIWPNVAFIKTDFEDLLAYNRENKLQKGMLAKMMQGFLKGLQKVDAIKDQLKMDERTIFSADNKQKLSELIQYVTEKLAELNSAPVSPSASPAQRSPSVAPTSTNAPSDFDLMLGMLEANKKNINSKAPQARRLLQDPTNWMAAQNALDIMKTSINALEQNAQEAIKFLTNSTIPLEKRQLMKKTMVDAFKDGAIWLSPRGQENYIKIKGITL